jgi:hypothetical protein
MAENNGEKRVIRRSGGKAFLIRAENAKYTGHNPPSGLGFINGEAITRDEKAAGVCRDTGFKVLDLELTIVEEVKEDKTDTGKDPAIGGKKEPEKKTDADKDLTGAKK